MKIPSEHSNPRQSRWRVPEGRNRASAYPSPRVVQIVPALPPRIDGVGDFASALAADMEDAFSISTAFVVRKADLKGLSVLTISEENESNLDCALKDALPGFSGTVILHYVGYGYDPFGSPNWLPNAVCKIRGRGHRIITIFHELYATGWPWERAFWNSTEQRAIFEGIVRASDVCVTSNPVYLRRIQAVSPSVVASMIPIPSNMGELESALPLSRRSRRMVIAGQRPLKQLALNGHRNKLLKACSLLELEEIIEIGEPCQDSNKLSHAAAQLGLNYRCTGWIPARNVSEILADTYCGIVAYDPSLWQKSGVIASYHAHGMLTVVIPEERASKHPVHVGIGVSLNNLLRKPNPNAQTLEAIASTGFESYAQMQSLRRYTALFVSLAEVRGGHARAISPIR